MKDSYSQNGEDLIILNALDRRGVTNGTVLDIGAWDPEDKSNSRLLIQQGWAAVLFEPSPKPVRRLIEFYGKRDDVKVVGAGVGFDAGLLKMQMTDDAVSSSDQEVQQTWKDQGGYYGYEYVPMVTIPQIFIWFGGPFHFVNIDAEGTSVDLAIAYLKTEAFPQVMCVEHNRRIEELAQVAQVRGYMPVHINGENIILEKVA